MVSYLQNYGSFKEKLNMSKKKQKKISSEARTCFVFAALFIIVGIAAIIYGKNFYHSTDMVALEDIKTGKTATIVSVEKRERELTVSEQKEEQKKGYSPEEIRLEYKVVYSVDVDGKEYTFEEAKRFRDDGSYTPHVGDTEVINYAIIDGEFIPNPTTQETNGTVICGYILLILSVISAGLGVFLRK